MEELLEILKKIKPGEDLRNCNTLIEDEILEVFKEGNVVDGLWDGEVKVNGGSKQEYISYYNNGLVEYYGEKFDEEVDIQFYATGKYANGGYAWTSNIEDTEGVNPFSFF